jgi:hypothetical protein
MFPDEDEPVFGVHGEHVETEQSYCIEIEVEEQLFPAGEVDQERLAELEDQISLLSADRCLPEFDEVLDLIDLPSLISLSAESFTIVVHAAAHRTK